jgi:phosphomannomutase
MEKKSGLLGTHGVRGVVGETITPELALALGRGQASSACFRSGETEMRVVPDERGRRRSSEQHRDVQGRTSLAKT